MMSSRHWNRMPRARRSRANDCASSAPPPASPAPGPTLPTKRRSRTTRGRPGPAGRGTRCVRAAGERSAARRSVRNRLHAHASCNGRTSDGERRPASGALALEPRLRRCHMGCRVPRVRPHRDLSRRGYAGEPAESASATVDGVAPPASRGPDETRSHVDRVVRGGGGGRVALRDRLHVFVRRRGDRRLVLQPVERGLVVRSAVRAGLLPRGGHAAGALPLGAWRRRVHGLGVR